MPPYYENDNIQCWIRAVITEKYESFVDGNDDEKDEYAKRISDYGGIRAEAQDAIEMMVDMRAWTKSTGTMPFVSAIMNTIDWEELLDDVAKDIEAENPDGEIKSCCRGTAGCPQCVSDFEEDS